MRGFGYQVAALGIAPISGGIYYRAAFFTNSAHLLRFKHPRPQKGSQKRGCPDVAVAQQMDSLF